MFKARIETVDTAPAFREAFKSKRCLIPASAFYEWTLNESDGKKDPWHIHLPGDTPFSFAGAERQAWRHELLDRHDASWGTDVEAP